MHRATLTYRIKHIAEKARVPKNVFPYLFRHSRGTELYEKLPEQQAKKLMGHARDSRMVEVYSHGTDESAIQSMMEGIYCVEKESPDDSTKLQVELADLKKQLADVQSFLQKNSAVLGEAHAVLQGDGRGIDDAERLDEMTA